LYRHQDLSSFRSSQILNGVLGGNRISTLKAGKLEDFMEVLQQKLDNKLDNPPDNQTITDIPLQ
jgi:hypothetical protein